MPKDETRYSVDIATVLGLLIGFGGIIAGLVLEGGKLMDIAQLTGGIIVLSGTIGAVMITTPTSTFFRAIGKFRLVILEPKYSTAAIISQLLDFSHRARRHGIVSLEADVARISDPFLRKAMALGVDGTELEELRRVMELDLDMEASRGRADAKVYEAAGGYAPTIGIIGAVLGLIQVMKHLQEMDKVGEGIAVAFVATVYGVGLANLLFLPAASKLKSRVEQAVQMKELMLEGVCSIVQGVHPKSIERKLESWAPGTTANRTERGVANGRLAEGNA